MEIQYSALLDYLLGKKFIPWNWGVQLKDIEGRLGKIIENRNQIFDEEEVINHLYIIKNDPKNYEFLNKLLEYLISSREGEKKTLFGYFKSPVINELNEMKKKYEEGNLVIAEVIKETNYLLNFGLGHLEKEQRDIMAKIKNTKKKVLEVDTATKENMGNFKKKLFDFGLEHIYEKIPRDINYFPNLEISEGVQEFYNIRLKEFYGIISQKVEELLEGGALVNIYLELIKEANPNLENSDEFILKYIIEFPTLTMFIEPQANNENNSELNHKEVEYCIEVIGGSDDVGVSENNIIDEKEKHIQFQILEGAHYKVFEDRQLFGNLLMELYEIESFLKRSLIESFGCEWDKISPDSLDERSQNLVKFHRLAREIIGQLTNSDNYETITYRRDKYTVVERHTDTLFSMFNAIKNQEESLKDLQARIKDYVMELKEVQASYNKSEDKIRRNINYLEEEFKRKLNKEIKIKVLI
ncbi:Centrin like EF hand protein [Cryptosporidium felis]|nr:Centrin like EF hand protein [Cryptosporidium felis]